MEYISAEEFLKQPRKIQEEFLEYSPVKEGDLFKDISDLDVIECLDYIQNDDEGMLYHSMKGNISLYDTIIPLLTEGQLRKFIIGKSNNIIVLTDYCDNSGYSIILNEKEGTEQKCYKYLGADLL